MSIRSQEGVVAEKSLRSRWDNLSLGRKALVCLATLAGIAALSWYLVFKPQMAKIDSLHKDIDRLDQSIATARAQVKALPKLEKEVAAKRRVLMYSQTLLPETDADAENLLSSIEELGNDAGIDFLLFTPGKGKTHEFYASRPIDVRFQGTFHNLMHFFDRLSGLDRLVTLESVQLQPVADNQTAGVTLQADCRLNIYRMLTEQELANQNRKSS